MSASSAISPARLPALLPRSERRPFEPDTEALKQKLLRRGVFPTPKILHALRKKETQKAIRRSKKQALEAETPPLSESQKQFAEEEARFRTVSREYHAVKEELERRNGRARALTVAGKPWERSDGVNLRRIASAGEEYDGGKLKGEHLKELREMLAERNGEDFRWLLDDVVEDVGGRVVEEDQRKRFPSNRMVGEEEKIQILVRRLSSINLSIQDWKFARLMKQSGLLFTENSLLKIVKELGALGNWRQALYVVEWVYNEKDYKHHKSRFVYTKLLAVLGKARKPSEALRIFNMMREDCQIYPDMAAYHSIAVTLGQAGLVKELINVTECMMKKPSKRLKNMRHKNWDPCLEPDVIIYNAVLNACVPSRQWKGVFWVLEQMRSSGLKPNGATYGLAMEVMLESGKYDLVHKFFGKMQRSGLALKALSYKVLVRAFWKEGKVDEAIEVVRDMERRGVVGTASIYYELACCLCNNGRWKEAMLEVEKLKKLPLTKPLEVAFTGMIQSSMGGGHLHDCISIFKHMKDHCAPNIGTINAMLKVYGRNDMFAKAKDLFEATKGINSGSYLDISLSLTPDEYSYSLMLEASASAHQWEYFEYLYKEMAIHDYQLDPDKYVWLLVEASRAGKWHLLEHAFDTIVEAGEIPHISLFTEMICQTVARQNYERAAVLVNSMAHASMQVSENQWIDLFKRSRDRISEDKLQRLLDVINDSNIVTEAPASNLLKSLHSICKPKILLDTSELTASNDIATDDSYVYHVDDSHMFPVYDMDDSGSTDVHIRLEEPADEVESGFSADSTDSEESDTILHENLEPSVIETAVDSLTRHIDFSSGAELPSASEILEAWMENRKNDGLSPFQL